MKKGDWVAFGVLILSLGIIAVANYDPRVTTAEINDFSYACNPDGFSRVFVPHEDGNLAPAMPGDRRSQLVCDSLSD